MPFAELCKLPREEFVAALDGVWEHSPWIAARAWDRRPFADIAMLHAAMRTVVETAPDDEQLALICAHPELAGKAASDGSLTRESHGEQTGAGLDRCTPAELARLTELNSAYVRKFGFPFIVAVRGYTTATIIMALATRTRHDASEERATALEQIAEIARLRLEDRLRATE